MQSAISKYINAEILLTSESSAKLCYDVDEQKTVDSHSVDNLESKGASNITSEKATDAKQLTDADIQKSETKNKALQILPRTTSVCIEEVVKNIQEIHTEAELAVTDTKERQISENEFEAKKEVSEYMLKRAFDLHKVACQTSAENEPKAEFLSEEQSYETIVTKHPNFERQTKEMNPTNETKEHEKVPASHTGEKLEIIDDRNFIQEGENEMEKQLKGSYLKLQLKEQTLEEEESVAIDNNSGRPENELEKMANVVETIYQHETMAKVNAKNEEHTNHHSEQSSVENVFTKHISEGMVTTENSTKSNVPEGKSISTLPTIQVLKVEIVEESIQEVIQKEAEPGVTNTREEQRLENGFVKNMKVLEALDLHKAPGNTALENEKKAKVKFEEKSREIILEHPHLEGLETAKISPSNDTKEPERNMKSPQMSLNQYLKISQSKQTLENRKLKRPKPLN
ncbi:hypothetical protein GmHk_19G054852 [Glycine max]|nr:hypothetical protein GmHk_19G054852 [Glycine max]